MHIQINNINMSQNNNNSTMDGDFSYIKDIHSRTMITNAYNAAKKLEILEFFKNDNPPENTGYMFWSDPTLHKFSRELDSDGHSGASFAWTCRNLQAYLKDPQAHKNLFCK